MYLLIILAFLIMIYVVYQIKNKFKGEKRKDILLLQVIIFSLLSLLVVQFVAGSWILIILAVVFLIILAVCPKKFYNWIKITFKL